MARTIYFSKSLKRVTLSSGKLFGAVFASCVYRLRQGAQQPLSDESAAQSGLKSLSHPKTGRGCTIIQLFTALAKLLGPTHTIPTFV